MTLNNPGRLMLLSLIVLAGFLIRIDGIGVKSMSHPEMWAPLIPLSADVADPPARNTLYEVLDYNLGKDTHPPGYYLLMWIWMKCFGWSTEAIRLPSVLCGAGCIVLVYLLCALCGRPRAGLIAAAIVAFNGYHAVWSGIGRMYAPAAFFALLSSVLLLHICHRPPAARPWESMAYFVATLIGLSCHILVWPVLVVQMLWVLWNARNQNVPLPESWNLQVATFLAGTPLLTFVVYQGHHPVAELSGASWLYAPELVQFGFLLPMRSLLDLFPRTPVAAWSSVWGPGFSLARACLLVVSAALLIAGLISARRAGALVPCTVSTSWRGRWTLAAAAALSISGIFVWIVRNKAVPISGTVLTAILPVPLMLGALLLSRLWPKLPAWRTDRGISLPVFLAVVQMLILTVLALVRPVLTQRGLLIVLPSVLILLAFGLDSIRPKLAAVIVGLPLAWLHLQSIQTYSSMTVDPTDFHLWTATVKPHVRDTDLFFVHRAWYSTPILYYIHPPQYHVYARDFALAQRQNPGARVWWMGVNGEEPPGIIRESLVGYHERQRISAGGGSSILFVPDTADSAAVVHSAATPDHP